MKLKWSDIPFAPAKLPFFYGWVVLAVCTLSIVSSIPGQTMGVGIFTDALMDALGLSRTQLSLAYALGTIASGLFLTRAGRYIDRHGLRVMGALSAAGLGLSLVLMSRATDLAAILPLPRMFAAMATVFVCFMSLRFFGQGCLTMVARVGIGQWFNRRRGRAVALMGLVTAFCFSVSPKYLNHLLETHGWQGASLILAALAGFGMTALALLFFRDRPEDCGLTMDGVPEPVTEGETGLPLPVQREFTLREATRTLAFWAYNLGPASQGLIVTALTFHLASIGEQAGLGREAAYSIFIPMAFFSVTTNMVGGWLSDRINLKWLLLYMTFMQFVGTAGLAAFGTPLGRWAIIVGFGSSGGLFSTMTTVPFPRYFGRAHLGAISGLGMSIMVYASAIGPYFFSKGLDLFGSYQAVILACLALPIATGTLGALARDPQQIAARDKERAD